jgi:hypothetical protein
MENYPQKAARMVAFFFATKKATGNQPAAFARIY